MAGIGIDTSAASSTVNNLTNSKSNSSLDKDAFLKLLVTQMQYQDPLEPTSNTEYMAQLAQFSTVEELQNLSNTFSTTQALGMAGQYVILNVPDATGKITQISGLVDYVTIKDGQAYFHIEDDYYPAGYLDSVVSLDYLEYLVNGAAGKDDSNNTEDEKNVNPDGNANAEGDTTVDEAEGENSTEGTEEA